MIRGRDEGVGNYRKSPPCLSQELLVNKHNNYEVRRSFIPPHSSAVGRHFNNQQMSLCVGMAAGHVTIIIIPAAEPKSDFGLSDVSDDNMPGIHLQLNLHPRIQTCTSSSRSTSWIFPVLVVVALLGLDSIAPWVERCTRVVRLNTRRISSLGFQKGFVRFGSTPESLLGRLLDDV